MERIIFKKDPKTILLSDNIYLIKNFINKDQIDQLLDTLESFNESDWYKHENVVPGDLEGDYWNGKLSLDILDTTFHDQVLNYFSPHGFWPYGHMNFVRLVPGQSSEINILEDDSIKYKLAIYLGKWTGGEIFFPNLNIEYKPEHNDLLVFKADSQHSHLTKPVISGNRYAYIDLLVEHPGYFMP